MRIPRPASSERPLNRFAAAVWCAAVLIPVGVGAVPWHHAASLYRAQFKVERQPNHPKAGLTIAVPVCNAGRGDGSDLFAFDGSGVALQLLARGAGGRNLALAQVSARPTNADIYVYFGSRAFSPQNRGAFVDPLTVDIRTFPQPEVDSWAQVNAAFKQSRLLGKEFVDSISLTYNPVDGTDEVLMDFTGLLKIDADGEHTFMLVSDDAGYLFIGDQLLIERNGRHYASDAARGEFRASIPLNKGLHPVRCLVADAGGGQMALLARWIDGHNKRALTVSDFAQPGRTRLITVEARNADAPCPIFWYRQVSYVGYADRQYTEVECGTYNGRQAKWQFGDGATAEGSQVRHVFCGPETQPVAVLQGRSEAEGVIAFSEEAVTQRNIGNPQHFDTYARLMLAEDLTSLAPATLVGYLDFLNYREFNPQTALVCQAMLTRPSLPAALRRSTFVHLARVAAAVDVDVSIKAFRALLKPMPPGDAEWPDLMAEFADIALHQAGNADLAVDLLARLSRELGQSDRRVLALQVDLALHRDEVATAEEYLQTWRRQAKTGAQQRLAAVRANALQQRFYDLLHAGFLLDAHAVLTEWTALAPGDRANGTSALAKARLWRTMGRLPGALALLDAAMRLNPLLPNLPEVEYEQSIILRETGDKEKANQICEHILDTYPNHPVAAKAGRDL